MVSRMVLLQKRMKSRFEELGFKDVTVTEEEKDSLNSMINKENPRLVIMSSSFYEGCTPFMIGRLLLQFPKLNIAAISLGFFPSELAMRFIIYGAKSYINLWEGEDEFYKGLKEIREGKEYISPAVQGCIEKRNVRPESFHDLTERQIEIVRLLCNGFTTPEIADVLHISSRTVDTHKTAIYTILNVRNENELIRVALYLGIIHVNELIFYGRDYVLNPRPDKKQIKKTRRVK